MEGSKPRRMGFNSKKYPHVNGTQVGSEIKCLQTTASKKHPYKPLLKSHLVGNWQIGNERKN
jgi:hypothetical protein